MSIPIPGATVLVADEFNGVLKSYERSQEVSGRWRLEEYHQPPGTFSISGDVDLRACDLGPMVGDIVDGSTFILTIRHRRAGEVPVKLETTTKLLDRHMVRVGFRSVGAPKRIEA